MSPKTMKFVLIALAVLSMLTFASGMARKAALNREAARILEECEEWELKLDDIHRETEAASSHDYVERIAREKLGLVKPGETLYIVAQPDSSGFDPVKPRPGHTPEIGD